MATVGDVRVKISANASKVSSALRKVGASFKRFAGVATSAIKAVAVAFIGIGVAALKSATTVEGAFKKIQVGTGATGNALNRLRGDFIKVFGDVPEAAGVVADSLANVNTLFGLSGKAAQALTKQMLAISRLTGGDASNNTVAFGRAMQLFGARTEDASDILDTFQVVTEKNAITFERLTRDVREFGPVLQAANIGIDEAARVVGATAKAGVNFSRVSPAMLQAFTKFAKEGKNVREEFMKYVVRVKEAGSQAEAQAILTEKFGTEVSRLAVAMRKGAFDLDANTKAIDRNRGAIKKTEEETRTFGDEMGKIRNKIVIALKPIGDAFLAMFRSVLPDIEDFIQRVGEDMPRLVLKAFDALADAATTFGPGFIQTFRGVVITMKSIALAATGIVIAFQKIRQVNAFKALDFEKVDKIGASLEGLKQTFGTLKDSIGEDIDALSTAQVDSEKWRDTILDAKDAWIEVQGKTKVTKDEVVKVEEATADLFVQMNKLKEPQENFIGTVKVAGEQIEISINKTLDVTKQKLIEIRNLMGETANAAAG